MTSNPLAKRRADEPIRDVRDHVDMLNRMAWVRASDRPYFVATTRKEDGTIEYRVDRAA
jgi:hypothetical protein